MKTPFVEYGHTDPRPLKHLKERMEIRDPLVIVVDDDASVRSSLSRLLRSVGMKDLGFASGEDLIKAGQVDCAACLIIDVQMPEMRGLELQKICAKQKPNLPIIMMSAFSEDDAETSAMAAGAIAFLHKPFDAAALVALLQDVIGQR